MCWGSGFRVQRLVIDPEHGQFAGREPLVSLRLGRCRLPLDVQVHYSRGILQFYIVHLFLHCILHCIQFYIVHLFYIVYYNFTLYTYLTLQFTLYTTILHCIHEVRNNLRSMGHNDHLNNCELLQGSAQNG